MNLHDLLYREKESMPRMTEVVRMREVLTVMLHR